MGEVDSFIKKLTEHEDLVNREEHREGYGGVSSTERRKRGVLGENWRIR